MKRNAGFTLVELLVVIGILSMLFVVLLNTILSGQQAANEFACKANLKSLADRITAYKASKGHYPPNGGVKFLWRLWRFGEQTTAKRDMFFCPEVRQRDLREETTSIPIQELWRDASEFTSASTDYAVRAAKYRKSMTSGNAALIADDNEGGSNHQTGAINVLYGDLSLKTFAKDDLEEQGIWPADADEDFYILVGPESPIKDLQKLQID